MTLSTFPLESQALTLPRRRLPLQALPRRQRGVTLIELMVGLLIGLMVVAVATGALMASRGISGTVSDASNIQQQAAYAMRVIGQQLRQTSSLYLNLNPQGLTGLDAQTMAAVGLQLQGIDKDTLTGTDSTVDASFTRYLEPVFIDADEISLTRNCLGAPSDSSADKLIKSQFELAGSNLRCGGNGAAPQPIIGNVADFQVRYLIQDNSRPGRSAIVYADADAVGGAWDRVQGIEVCLVLFGQEAIGIPDGSTYTGCDGEPHVYANNRMHLVFRNVFQLRSQGLL